MVRPGLSEGDIHDVLRNGRRRSVIRELRAAAGGIALGELAERIAEQETGQSPAPRNLRDSVYNSLHQTHLPKLDDLGIVSYDREAKTVELEHHARSVSLYMEVLTPYGFSWARFYQVAAIVSLFAVVLATSGVSTFALFDVRVVAGVSLVALAAVSLFQVWSRRWVILHDIVD